MGDQSMKRQRPREIQEEAEGPRKGMGDDEPGRVAERTKADRIEI